jgi:hypothetical protein
VKTLPKICPELELVPPTKELDDEPLALPEELETVPELVPPPVLELERYGQALLNVPPGGQTVCVPDKQVLSASKTQ